MGIRELVMSSLIRPCNINLLTPWIMNQFDQGHRAEAMAMTLIGVGTSTVDTYGEDAAGSMGTGLRIRGRVREGVTLPQNVSNYSHFARGGTSATVGWVTVSRPH